MAKISKEEWEQRVNNAGDGKYKFVRWAVDGAFGSNHKCVFRCAKDRYEWSAKVNSVVNCGQGCPQCAGKRRWTAEERVDQINELENIEFISFDGHYKNSYSKANVRCLVDEFEWISTVNDLVNTGRGCPQCSGNRKWASEERIEHINSLNNIEFVSWVYGYKNGKSKANVRCMKDGFEWAASVSNLVNHGNGCPNCSKKRIWTADERIEQINKLENIEFVCWVDYHNGNGSKANVKCEIDGFEWAASVSNLVNQGNGCPKCAKHGFNQAKTGYLYALRSECGMYVKIGISNNPSRRHTELARATPFTFNLVEQFSGDGAKIAELEKHFHSKYESACFTGFDGCTEWLICTPELLEELRKLGD